MGVGVAGAAGVVATRCGNGPVSRWKTSGAEAGKTFPATAGANGAASAAEVRPFLLEVGVVAVAVAVAVVGLGAGRFLPVMGAAGGVVLELVGGVGAGTEMGDATAEEAFADNRAERLGGESAFWAEPAVREGAPADGGGCGGGAVVVAMVAVAGGVEVWRVVVDVANGEATEAEGVVTRSGVESRGEDREG